MDTLRKTLDSLYDKYVALCREQTSKCSAKVPELDVNDCAYLENIYWLGEPTYSEFAKDSNISKPAATQIIKRFIDKGYVEKLQSQEDKRVYHIRLREMYRQYFEEVAKAEEKLFEQIVSILSKSEVSALSNLLGKIDENMDIKNHS